MIKYHYYGLNGNRGYETIAKSEGIPEEVLVNVQSIAEQYCENDGFAKNQMHMIVDDGYMVFGNSTEFPPQEGESRKSFFCQQYLLDKLDQGQYLLKLPQLIANLPFITERQQEYPTSSQTLPEFSDSFEAPEIEESFLKQIVQAVLEVTLDTAHNRQVFICLDRTENYEKRVRTLLGQIVKFLPLEARRRLGFTTYADSIEGKTLWYRIVFCANDDIVAFKNRYQTRDCFYVYLDDKKIEPATKSGSYLDHLFQFPEQVDRLVFLCDAKLSGELKTDICAYNALLDLIEACSAKDNLEGYLPNRDHILRYLESFYDVKTITQEFVENIYQKELLLAQKPDVKLTEDSLVVWTAFYLEKVLSEEKLIAYMFLVQGERNNHYISEFIKRHDMAEAFYQYSVSKGVVPSGLVDDIAAKLRLSTNILEDIDQLANQYTVKAVGAAKVLESITLYFKEKVDGSAENKQALFAVKESVEKLQKYPVPAFRKIQEAVENRADEYLKKIEELEQLTRMQKKRKKEREELLKQYGEAFSSPYIESIENPDLFGKMNRLQVSKEKLDAFALQYYKEHKLPLALLYVASNFDEYGVITTCDFTKIESVFLEEDGKDERKALQKAYRFFVTLTRFKDFTQMTVIERSIAEYFGTQKGLFKIAKKKQEEPYQLMLQYGVLNPKNVKLPVLIISGLLVLLVIGAGILLALNMGRGTNENSTSSAGQVSQETTEDWNASSHFSLGQGFRSDGSRITGSIVRGDSVVERSRADSSNVSGASEETSGANQSIE